MIKTLLHLAGVVNFGFALHYDFTVVDPNLCKSGKFKDSCAFPGRWKYLTIWNMVLQLAYHSIALANDLVGTSALEVKRQGALQRLRDGIFASWAFPVGMLVSLCFWILYGIDRALVLPVELDPYFPSLLNHAVHTGPIVLMLLELAYVPKIYPPSDSGISANMMFTIVYMSWITWAYLASGVWAYPVLQVLSNFHRGLFMGGNAVAILGLYFLGQSLNNKIWGKPVQEQKTKKSKRQ